MDEWIDGWIDGRMDVWMDVCMMNKLCMHILLLGYIPIYICM